MILRNYIISRNFYEVISRYFVLITRNFYKVILRNFAIITYINQYYVDVIFTFAIKFSKGPTIYFYHKNT